MEPLAPAARRALRARAHHLRPVVTIGQHGLSPAVLQEIDVALTAHELIKVRVMGDDRNARESLLGRICTALDCGAVQQIGKLLVLWRPLPAGSAPLEATPARPKRPPRAGGPHAPAKTASRRRLPEAATTRPEPARRHPPRTAAPPPGVPRAAGRRRRRASS